jgi:uncharacterized protein with PQ loop repeat
MDAYFGECIITVQQQCGFWLGILSTVIWMIAQIPQVVLNCRAGSVTGVSPAFLICIVVGDVSNLIGIFVVGGLTTQIITAAWYTVIDGTAFVQWFYYHCLKRPEVAAEPEPLPWVPGLPLLIAKTASVGASNPYEPPMLWGTLLGWLSAALYLGSRIPQLRTNYERQKTDGLSPGYFVSALFGNTTYAASIFLQNHSWKWIWKQFPWLVGSLGTLFFDVALISQFVRYAKRGQLAGEEGAQLLLTTDSTTVDESNLAVQGG